MLSFLRRWLNARESLAPAVQDAGQRSAGAPEALVAEALRANREDIARLRDEFAQMQLDWASTLDKIKKWANRQAARERAAAEAALQSMEEKPEQQTLPIVDPRTLTKAQLRQRVAALKNGGVL